MFFSVLLDRAWPIYLFAMKGFFFYNYSIYIAWSSELNVSKSPNMLSALPRNHLRNFLHHEWMVFVVIYYKVYGLTKAQLE